MHTIEKQGAIALKDIIALMPDTSPDRIDIYDESDLSSFRLVYSGPVVHDAWSPFGPYLDYRVDNLGSCPLKCGAIRIGVSLPLSSPSPSDLEDW